MQKILGVLALLLMLSGGTSASGLHSAEAIEFESEEEFLQFIEQGNVQLSEGVALEGSPNPFFRTLFKIRNGKGKSKTVAAVLAFPLTGITGIHRVYLGTAPYVPVVYMLTLGGCVGILPFIDFVVILTENDLSRYEDNRKLFMWMK